MSATLVDFVETTLLVNEVTRANYGADSLPNLEPIADAALLESQAKTAEEIAAGLVPTIAGEGLDPSYMQLM